MIFGFEEVEHKKEVHKLINYLANEFIPYSYMPPSIHQGEGRKAKHLEEKR